MERSFDKFRRSFIWKTIAAGAIAAVSTTSFSASQAVHSKSGPSGASKPSDEIAHNFMVNIKGDLYSSGKSMMVELNNVSSSQDIEGKGLYRVKIVPFQHLKKYGYTYRVYLCDGSGKPLSFINLGSNATGTFTSYGIQVTISAISS